MEKGDSISLTSGEIAHLWVTFQGETMNRCGTKFFLQHVDDEQTKEILEKILALSNKRIERVTEILTHENYPLPVGFTDDDVNLNAPRLFSDALYLYFCLETLKIQLLKYSLAMLDAVRPEIQ